MVRFKGNDLNSGYDIICLIRWKTFLSVPIEEENYLTKADYQLEGLKRVLTAWQYGAQDQLIADAAVFDNRLYVLNCVLKRYEISFESIKALARIPKKDRDNFLISEEGSHISWTEHDVDLDLDSIRVVVDPAAARKAQVRKLSHDKRFGAAIAKLRKEKGLLQNQISGLTDRQVRRIEAGEHATLKSLEILAEAHKMGLNQYLNAVAGHVHKNSVQ
jgi:hypothetical protein